MQRQGRRLFVFAIIVLMMPTFSLAAPSDHPLTSQAVVPSPTEEDANLTDIQFVGTQNGWAVGEQGVIWKTTDGGRSWQFSRSPVPCTLRSVCFLTDRVGWIVGGGTTPYTRTSFGVVLFTNNGGADWKVLSRDVLPSLQSVKFFGLKQGVAVGATSSHHPTGVFSTNDGGTTWQAVPGKPQDGWRTADFLNQKDGVIAGMQGRYLSVGNGRLLEARFGTLGLRGLRDVKLQRAGVDWLVGDGGLVLRSDNDGGVWQSPPTPLPDELRDVIDFRSVACRGAHTWIAGHPGTVVWHTADSGRTWNRQLTGQPLPINSLTFSSESIGWAAGAMGLLLKTENGGQTWESVRGGGRRAALLSVHSRPSRVSFHLIAKQSGDLGYRSVVLLPARRDVGPDGHARFDEDLRLQEAVNVSGGSVGETGWQFPIAASGLEHDAEKLLADWNRRTENRFGEVFLGGLVRQLRVWRPTVVVIDSAPADDATTNLLNQAIVRAVDQAGDPTRFVQHQELLGLKPWRVKKIFERMAPGSTGHTHIDTHEYLPRMRSPIQVVAARARSLFKPVDSQSAQREAYRLVLDFTQLRDEGTASSHFFAGTPITQGSDARRRLAPLDEEQLARHQKLAERQRNFKAYTEKFLDDPRHAGQLIAELKTLTSGMPAEQGASQLLQLANDYRKRSQWDYVEATLVELVSKYPDEPMAADAMRWLFQLWTGFEPAWQRARNVQVRRGAIQLTSHNSSEWIQRAIDLSQIDPKKREYTEIDSGPDPLKLVTADGRLKMGNSNDWRIGSVRRWHDQAALMAALIQKKSPGLYRTPQIQFPLAALFRHRGNHTSADASYRLHAGNGIDDPWSRTALGELWVVRPVHLPPKRFGTCQRAVEPPFLDGLLSDECWQTAQRFALSAQEVPSSRDKNAKSFAMLCYDANYLYFAAGIERFPGTATDRPMLPGRTHDAHLTSFDRVGLYLDVDRDYATYYSLMIDQRGWTADACWEDASWNPKWHVAADADATHWRVEAAIPLSELVPNAPTKNHVWAVGIVRTIPAVGVESWSHPAGSEPRPESFGLIRFD